MLSILQILKVNQPLVLARVRLSHHRGTLVDFGRDNWDLVLEATASEGGGKGKGKENNQSETCQNNQLQAGKLVTILQTSN